MIIYLVFQYDFFPMIFKLLTAKKFESFYFVNS